MKILGLTGLNASGKSTVAQFLIEKGYKYYSLSDVVREYASQKNLDHSRENLILCGNELREKFGADVLAKIVLDKIRNEKPEKVLIDSIRNVYEIETLKNFGNFKIIGLTAPANIRFERALKRKRVGFETTLEDFINIEKVENSSDPKKQQLFKCLEMSDIVIDNNGSVEELKNKLEEVLKKIGYD